MPSHRHRLLLGLALVAIARPSLANTQMPALPSVPAGSPLPAWFRDAALVFAVALALGLMLLVWARFIRKRRRHRTFGHRSSAALPEDLDGDNPSPDRAHRHRHHRRRRRREHRGRNPTLFETGGLPPPRPPGQPPA
jgi:hypothetical protein